MILKDLHKYQYFRKKFLDCNQISSTGFCSGALGANKIQVIDQSSASLSRLTSALLGLRWKLYNIGTLC
jgi:hypothetical protein